MTPADLDLRFRVFARAWAIAVLLGMMSQDMATTPLRVVVTCLCVAVIVLPVPVLLSALTVAYMVHWQVDPYRQDYVHTWLLFLFSLAQAIALATTASRDSEAWRRRFVEAFAPVGVILAGFCLFAAGFAKLNSDFSDTATSCAAIFYAHQRTLPMLGWLPDAPWAERFAIRFVQVAEVSGGLLTMAHWRARKFGFGLALVTLFLVGTNPIGRLYEFTSPFLALMTLGCAWEPPSIEVPTAVAEAGRRALPWIRAVLAVGLAAAVLAAMTVDRPSPHVDWRFSAGRALFAVLAVGLGAGVAGFGRPVPLGRGGPGLPLLAWMVVAFLVVYESLPYLGIGSSRNMTMAGNLLINTRLSNHWIVREVPELPFNRLAVLDSSSDPLLAQHGRAAWVDWKLFDYLSRRPDASVTFELGGERVVLAHAADDPRVHPSWIAAHLPIMLTTIAPGPVGCGKKRRPKR